MSYQFVMFVLVLTFRELVGAHEVGEVLRECALLGEAIRFSSEPEAQRPGVPDRRIVAVLVDEVGEKLQPRFRRLTAL